MGPLFGCWGSPAALPCLLPCALPLPNLLHAAQEKFVPGCVCKSSPCLGLSGSILSLLFNRTTLVTRDHPQNRVETEVCTRQTTHHCHLASPNVHRDGEGWRHESEFCHCKVVVLGEGPNTLARTRLPGIYNQKGMQVDPPPTPPPPPRGHPPAAPGRPSGGGGPALTE